MFNVHTKLIEVCFTQLTRDHASSPRQ